MDIAQALLISLAVFLGGVVSGFAGFAFAAPAGAVLAFAFPPGVTVPLLFLCGLVNQSLSIWTLRSTMQWKQSVPYLIGGLVGLPIGLASLQTIGVGSFRHAFGGLLIVYSAIMLLKPKRLPLAERASHTASVAMGAAGGFVGGFTAMPGAVPAVWLDLQGRDKDAKRGTLQPFIFGMQIVSLPILLVSQNFRVEPWMIAVAVPALVLGTRTGVGLFGRISDRVFRAGTLVLLITSGILLEI